MKNQTEPTLIDLFAGCGGVTTGFKAKNFKVLAAVEFDPIIAQTYRLNHPEVIVYEDNICHISPDSVMHDCQLAPGQLTVLSVCAPCQPFSKQNRNRNSDSRALLVLESLRFIEVFRPVFVFFENVPGLGQHSTILKDLIDGLNNLGYQTSQPIIIDAVNYGVPQFRKRFILLATFLNIDLSLPPPTHFAPETAKRLGKSPWLTVGDAFFGLSVISSGEQDKNDPLHKARNHSLLTLERLKYIPHNGGSRKSMPDHLELLCHKRSSTIGYHDVYGRMDLNKPANTLTTGCTNITKGRFAHPISNRAITLREAARLQTFPDTYKFAGNYDQISAQIGNAVPVKLAEALADHFLMMWNNFLSN